MSKPLRVATRRSPLALAQANAVGMAIARATGRELVLVPVTSEGDLADQPLTDIGGTGVFVGAIREAVLDDRADLAVHSLKDLPTQPCDGLTTAAIPKREDPRDAFCAAPGTDFDSLPAGARIGTGSPRRVSQLKALRPDLEIAGVRGNVDTRLRKVSDGEYTGVVLAAAGLARLRRLEAVTNYFEPEQMLPAPGQGALAVEARTDHGEADLDHALTEFDDDAVRAAVTAERAVLAKLEAGCSAPVGALGTVDDDGQMLLRAVAAHAETSQLFHISMSGPASEPSELGERVALALLDSGAGDQLKEKK